MRLALVAVLMAALVCYAGAAVRTVTPQSDPYPTIQSAMLVSAPGDTVVLSPGTYRDVERFNTSIGLRTAVCKLASGVTLRGMNSANCVIDHTATEIGILCANITGGAIRNLTVRGGIGRDSGRQDDGDGRGLVAGIMCLENASPTIERVRMAESATGIVVRGGCAPVIRSCIIARGSHHGIYIFMNGSSPVVIDHTTIVQNFDAGVYVFAGSAAISSSCITHSGKPGVYSYECLPSVTYSNVFQNGRTLPVPVEYGGWITDQTGQNGNISLEPFYCDFTGALGYDYSVCIDSPNVGSGEGGTNIGARGGTCTQCVSPVTRATWGAIKALYR
ncbi:MAG: right-handed parallel beta-helix repeat-containing protein [Candidatus Eisenbacteria bacterium]|nr:right-handed parallel beta-helix repeat-containing protein [Candidatus Eisenbacteria bacterium]